MYQIASFVVGPRGDPDLTIKERVEKEPMWGIPAWNPGKNIRYHHFWVNTLGSGTDVITLLWVFRANKGLCDKPRFYYINKNGVFEAKPEKEKKELEYTKQKRDGTESDPVLITTSPLSHRFEWVKDNFIWFDCPHCAKRVMDCECDKLHQCKECGTKWVKVVDLIDGKETPREVCPVCEKDDLKPLGWPADEPVP